MKKKNQSVSVIIIVFFLGIGAIYFWVNNKNISQNNLTSPSLSNTWKNDENISNIDIIKKLEGNFEIIQEKIPFKPALGAYMWYGPNHAQFISEDRILISFEDGHLVGIAIVEYDRVSNSFILLHTIPDYDFQYTQENWSALIKKYGKVDYIPENYTKSIWRNYELETFPDWTKVSENLFIK